MNYSACYSLSLPNPNVFRLIRALHPTHNQPHRSAPLSLPPTRPPKLWYPQTPNSPNSSTSSSKHSKVRPSYPAHHHPHLTPIHKTTRSAGSSSAATPPSYPPSAAHTYVARSSAVGQYTRSPSGRALRISAARRSGTLRARARFPGAHDAVKDLIADRHW